MKFPDDFEVSPHSIIPGAKQWSLKVPDDSPIIETSDFIAGQTIISVVGGGMGLYGNGVTTFEMWDYREDDIHGHLSAEDINTHLEKNPL